MLFVLLCAKDKPMTFSGSSYVRWRLTVPMERRLNLQLELRTVQPHARLMHAVGRVDYSILEVNMFICSCVYVCITSTTSLPVFCRRLKKTLLSVTFTFHFPCVWEVTWSLPDTLMFLLLTCTCRVYVSGISFCPVHPVFFSLNKSVQFSSVRSAILLHWCLLFHVNCVEQTCIITCTALHCSQCFTVSHSDNKHDCCLVGA